MWALHRSLRAGGRGGTHVQGEAANCAEYVFGHYLQAGRRQELLQLPGEFDDALTHWLDEQVIVQPPDYSPK